MPSLFRSACGLLLVALSVGLALSWSASAGPPDGLEVTIVKGNGDVAKTFIASDAKQDINTSSYRVRQPDGTLTPVDIQKGVSVYSLLDYANVVTGYKRVTFPGPNGRTITLTRSQVEAPSSPGFFKDDATGKTMFIGAPPTKGANYVEAKDYFPIELAALEIAQAGVDVDVDVDASRVKIEPGESVKFTATASPSGSYTYKWTFEPGVTKTAGRVVSHRFEKAGSYKVGVGVYSDDDSVNAAGGGGIKVQVGDPKDSDKDREGGGDNGAAGAPTSGTSTGSSGAGVGTGSSTPYTPSYTPTPSVPSTPSTPSTTPPKTPGIVTDGTPVEGNLLADVTDPPPSNILESAARAAREGKPNDDSKGTGVSEAAVSIVGVLALLGLGAGIESRQGRLPRLRLPRRAA